MPHPECHLQPASSHRPQKKICSESEILAIFACAWNTGRKRSQPTGFKAYARNACRRGNGAEIIQETYNNKAKNMTKTTNTTQKNKQAESQNLLQHMVYALITVVITVHAFVLYSLYFVEGDSLMQATGTSSFAQAIRSQGGVYMFGTYLPVWAVILVETVCAFVLAVAVGSPLAFRLANRKFDPRRNHPMIFESAIITATVCIMCPSMSLLADLFYYPYYDGFSLTDFMLRWFRLVCYNLPFAYFSQMFFVQPFVRFAIRKLFSNKIEQRNEQNPDKTVKPQDETEAIADIIIRENEIAVGK